MKNEEVNVRKGNTTMMGTKARTVAPLMNISLEDLVPQDHLYRHLEQTLDLSFVRTFVQETYAQGGRPSIDPVVFFKLQLVLFFEGIRSERELMRQAADRLSILWYLGYTLGETLPDHSSLTRIRARYGVAVFRRFFEEIVDQRQRAGLVWEKSSMPMQLRSRQMQQFPHSLHALPLKLIWKTSFLEKACKNSKVSLRGSNRILPF
jgi:transposase